jgi:hypothetical protein
MKKQLGILVILVTCIFLMFGSANATPMLDFFIDGAQTDDAISYAGSSSPLVGINLKVVSVKGVDTPKNANVPFPVDGLLNFTTGASTGLWTWEGVPSSSISLSGSVPDISGAGPNLLSGTFGTATVAYIGGAFPFHISGASFYDLKDSTLLTFFGLPTNAPDGSRQYYSGNFNISFDAPFTTTGAAFTSDNVVSGNLRNVVPEPGTLLLLGTAMTGLGLVGFRRKFRK